MKRPTLALALMAISAQYSLAADTIITETYLDNSSLIIMGQNLCTTGEAPRIQVGSSASGVEAYLESCSAMGTLANPLDVIVANLGGVVLTPGSYEVLVDTKAGNNGSGSTKQKSDKDAGGDTNRNSSNVGTFVVTAGAIGEQGIQGETGETGPQGEQGIQGEVGATGPQGEQGIRGEVGATGPQGEQGIQGEVGATGPQGDQGPKGNKGAQGDKGDQGEVGPRGPKGDSVPQIIGENSITSAHIAFRTVTADDMGPGSVQTGKIADKAVTSDKLDNGSVGKSKMKSNAVDSAIIEDGSVKMKDMEDWNGGNSTLTIPGVIRTEGLRVDGPVTLLNKYAPGLAFGETHDAFYDGFVIAYVSKGGSGFTEIKAKIRGVGLGDGNSFKVIAWNAVNSEGSDNSVVTVSFPVKRGSQWRIEDLSDNYDERNITLIKMGQ